MFQTYDQTYLLNEGKVNVSFLVDDQNAAISLISKNHEISLWLSYSVTNVSPEVTLIFTIYGLPVFFGTQRPGKIIDTYYRHQIIPIILSISFVFMVSIVEFIIGFNSLFGIMNP